MINSEKLLYQVVFKNKSYKKKILYDENNLQKIITSLNKLKLEVSLFYDHEIINYTVKLVDISKKNINISSDSMYSFIEALTKAFNMWYILYCNKTVDELMVSDE